MIFGTNTQFGIKAGASPTSVPEVTVGYSRQEAVVLPLVANASDNGSYQKPCNPASPVDAVQSEQFVVHPCLLVAFNGSAQDSYSVLASFGAKFGGEANGQGVKASGGLAQYFATGMAAQLLALSGGAAVVAVGESATESAKTPPQSSTVASLFGNETTFARGVGYRDAYLQFRTKLLAKIELTDPANLAARITAFEAAVGATGTGVAIDCSDIAACKAAVTDNDAYRNSYGPKQATYDQAVLVWAIP
jgi:hypothetical protein